VDVGLTRDRIDIPDLEAILGDAWTSIKFQPLRCILLFIECHRPARVRDSSISCKHCIDVHSIDLTDDLCVNSNPKPKPNAVTGITPREGTSCYDGHEESGALDGGYMDGMPALI